MPKKQPVKTIGWKVHTPNLLDELHNNNGMDALRIPMLVFRKLLGAVAK